MLDHKGTQTLETNRLILRKFSLSDADDMFNNWASDSDVTRYLSWSAHKNVDLTKQLITIWVDDYNNEDHYQWVIELKDTGEVIGNISFLKINDRTESCEIGYCMGKAYWNKGIMTEALSKVIQYGFEIGFERIAARFDVKNEASGRVMEKCHMEYEGTLRKICHNNQGELVDCRYYSILREDY